MKHIIKNLLFIAAFCVAFAPLRSQSQIDSIDALDAKTPVAFDAQPAWRIVGAVSSVGGEQLEKTFTSNVATALYGRLSGLWSNQGSGEAGSDAPTLYSRGISTFGSGKEMLYVIDGVPSTQTFFQQLVPQEIESVTLLKDASATAIYGQRGANGVLLVTTRRGFISPLKVSFSVQYGLQQASRLPEFLDSYNYATLYNEARLNDGLGIVYDDDALAHYRSNDDPQFYPNVDWYDVLLRQNAPLTNYNFTARGGTEIVQYNVLFNAVNNSGLYERTEPVSNLTRNQSYIRYNFRTNIDVALARRLSMMLTLGGSVENKTNPGSGESTDGVFNNMATIPPNAFPVEVDLVAGGSGGSSMYSNPWADITKTGYTSYGARALQASTKLTGDLGFAIPGLSISANIGFNSYFKSFSNKSRSYVRYSSSGEKVYGEETSLTADESPALQWRNFVLQGFMNYKHSFNDKHDVDAMLMAYYDDQTRTNNYIWNDSENNTPIPFKNTGAAGRFGYTFDKRYIAEFAFGYSGYDNFAPGKRFGFFPAGAVGWIVSNESFFESAKNLVPLLKFRASYGLTGNENTGADRYPYKQYYIYTSSYYFGPENAGVTSLIQGAPATPNITWEKEKQANIGVELNILKKIDFTFDYFMRNRYDILDKPYSELPDMLGFTLPSLNVGKVENKGFEAALRYTDSAGDWNWFAEMSVWNSRNKITYTSEAPKLYDYLYATGNPVGQMWGLEAIGFFADDADIAASPKQTFSDVQPGDIKYKNQNDDDVIDNNDFVAIGYPIPEWFGGLQLGIAWKQFDLSAFFQGTANRSIYWSGKYFEAFRNYGKVSPVALDRWAYFPDQGIDTRATATYPRLSSNDNQNNYQTSTFWLKNGDYLKLRSLELGYTIPEKWTNKINIETLRVFFNGTNLFSLDHQDGLIDPETVSGGVGYPVLRTFSLGVKIDL